VPWRNGRGTTEELLVRPEGASFERGDFDLRISKAGVTDAGRFSAFPGFDRVLVVTDGDGLALSHGDAAPPKRLVPLVPYAFSGDWPTEATLLGGPVRDFNVIVRSGRVRAEVWVLRVERGATRLVGIPTSIADLFLHVLTGEVNADVQRGDAMYGLGVLASGESLWLEAVSGERGENLLLWRPAGVGPETAVVLAVCVLPA
jgi:environmental stress-induced protein Ves